MRVAILEWNERVHPVFDTLESVKVYSVEGKTFELVKEVVVKAEEQPMSVIKGLNIDTLVCGAIPYRYERELNSLGIDVIPFISGDVGDVVKAFIENRLSDPSFNMPGCTRRAERGKGGDDCRGFGRRKGIRR